jgi:hypothetical protein
MAKYLITVMDISETAIDLDDIGDLEIASIIEYINKVYIDTEKTGLVDTQKRRALTTFLIAKELFKAQGLQENISEGYIKKVKKLIRQIDEVNFSN